MHGQQHIKSFGELCSRMSGFHQKKKPFFSPSEGGVWFEYFYEDGKNSVNAADVTHVPTLSSTCSLHSVWFIETAKRKVMNYVDAFCVESFFRNTL